MELILKMKIAPHYLTAIKNGTKTREYRWLEDDFTKGELFQVSKIWFVNSENKNDTLLVNVMCIYDDEFVEIIEEIKLQSWFKPGDEEKYFGEANDEDVYTVFDIRLIKDN